MDYVCNLFDMRIITSNIQLLDKNHQFDCLLHKYELISKSITEFLLIKLTYKAGDLYQIHVQISLMA